MHIKNVQKRSKNERFIDICGDYPLLASSVQLSCLIIAENLGFNCGTLSFLKSKTFLKPVKRKNEKN